MRSDLCEGILAGGCRQSSNTVTERRGDRGAEGEYVVVEMRAKHGAPCAALQAVKHMGAKRDGIDGLTERHWQQRQPTNALTPRSVQGLRELLCRRSSL